MQSLIEEDIRTLCRIEDIEDNSAKGFPPAPGGFNGLLAVRRGDNVYVYLNNCPHIGTPLDWMPDKFMTVDRKYLICAVHGAEFEVSDGKCLRGPCQGEYLEAVPFEIRDGTICVAANAGL